MAMALFKLLFPGVRPASDTDILTIRLRNHVVGGDIPSFKKVLELRKVSVNVVLDEYGKTALHYAVYCGRIEMVKWLLEEGADVNIQDVNQQVPLHMVFPNVDLYNMKVNMRIFRKDMQSGEFIRHAIAVTLLQNNADPNFKDKEGSTPLHFALLQRSFSLMTLLMHNGADISISNQEGVTPLHLTTPVGVLDLALVCYGDLDAQDVNGETLLHKVMRPTRMNFYSPEIVRKMLKLGATVDIEDKNHRTPYSVCMSQLVCYFRLNRIGGELFGEPLNYRFHLENKINLVRHIVKLKTAGIRVRDDVSLQFSAMCHYGPGGLRKLEEDCREELKVLAESPVHGRITLAHVLKCKSLTAHFMADEENVERLEEKLRPNDLKKRFPIYTNILRNIYNKSTKRFYLVRRALQSLSDLNRRHQSVQVLVKDLCAVEYLFQYLSDRDLENLIASAYNKVDIIR